MEQSCKTESVSFHHVWSIQKLSSITKKQLQSKIFKRVCLNTCGAEISWHYVLKWTDTNVIYPNIGREYSGKLTAVVNFCNCSSNPSFMMSRSIDHYQQNSYNQINEDFVKLLPESNTDSKTFGFAFDFYVKKDMLSWKMKLTLDTQPVAEAHAESELLQNYTSLLTNEQLSDVTIHVGKDKFYAQRAILSIRSPVFAAMFQSGMQEAKLGLITIKDIEPAVFLEVLRFIYTDKVNGLDKMAHELLAAADKYSLNKLRKMSETHLLGHLKQETIMQTLILADLYHAQELKDHAIRFICETMQGTDWKDFCCNHPELVADIFSKMAIK